MFCIRFCLGLVRKIANAAALAPANVTADPGVTVTEAATAKSRPGGRRGPEAASGGGRREPSAAGKKAEQTTSGAASRLKKNPWTAMTDTAAEGLAMTTDTMTTEIQSKWLKLHDLSRMYFQF